METVHATGSNFPDFLLLFQKQEGNKAKFMSLVRPPLPYDTCDVTRQTYRKSVRKNENKQCLSGIMNKKISFSLMVVHKVFTILIVQRYSNFKYIFSHYTCDVIRCRRTRADKMNTLTNQSLGLILTRLHSPRRFGPLGDVPAF